VETMSATTTAAEQSEARLLGRSIAPGLGMGPAWVVGDVLNWNGPPTRSGPNDVDGELVRLAHSYEETLAELDRYAKRIEAEFDSAFAGVFRAHGKMLRELFTSGEFERELRASLLTAEVVVRRVLLRWYQKFQALENPTFRQRADDVLDLGRNIIRRLRGEPEDGFKTIPERRILVVERLLPSDVVSLRKSNVVTVVVETLGQGSHAALLAREKGIPRITEIPDILSQISNGTELLVDGFRGALVIAPNAATQADFQQRLEKWQASLVRCKAACREPARTLDGQLIHVEANIGIQDDVEIALDNGADGVGLLRNRVALLCAANAIDRGRIIQRARKPDCPAGRSAGHDSPSGHRWR
jgi:phosphotransferase system enzyme I (PtsI)